MKIAINLTPEGSEGLWKQLLGELFTQYTPVVEKLIPTESPQAGQAKVVLLQMIDPLYAPLVDLSKALLVFVFDETDNQAGIIETTVEQFTLDNRVQDTLAALRQRILSSRVEYEGVMLESYDVEAREAFYKHVEGRLMELIQTLYDVAFGDVDEITFRFSKRKVDEHSR